MDNLNLSESSSNSATSSSEEATMFWNDLPDETSVVRLETLNLKFILGKDYYRQFWELDKEHSNSSVIRLKRISDFEISKNKSNKRKEIVYKPDIEFSKAYQDQQFVYFTLESSDEEDNVANVSKKRRKEKDKSWLPGKKIKGFVGEKSRISRSDATKQSIKHVIEATALKISKEEKLKDSLVFQKCDDKETEKCDSGLNSMPDLD